MADVDDKGFHIASFSSRGPTKDNRLKPEIAAPGVAVMAARSGSGNSYVSYSGTSMATPFVSGTIVLMLDARPSLVPQGVLEILQATAVDWGPPGQDVDYGFGRLDGYAAVKQAGNFGGTAPQVPGHRRLSGILGGTGQRAEHGFTVTATTYPLAVTMIMPEWSGRSSPDFDLYVYGPDGSELGKSTGTSRQETVSASLARTGTYRMVVQSYSGSGQYFVDISGAVESAGDDAPPQVSIEAPEEGSIVSGAITVLVKATDDQRVDKVEVAVAGGAWQEITGSKDGSIYRYSWNTEPTENGDQEIKARATDAAGKAAEAQRTVTVRNGGAPGRVHEKTMTGSVSASGRDSWQEVTVHSAGWVDLKLEWATGADLDLYVYAPDGTQVGRAYTLKNPETFQIDTERWGTGAYRVKVNLYAGGATGFALTANGFQVDQYVGHVSQGSRDFMQDRYVSHMGTGRVWLSWLGIADLDFYVYDPNGAMRTRAYTLRNPEAAQVAFDRPGYWRVRVNLYQGGATGFTLRMTVPEPNLS